MATPDDDTARDVRDHFFFVKENVSSSWKDLAFHLKFSHADVNNIAGKNNDDKSCCMDLLEKWLDRNGEGATIEALLMGLSEANLQSTADALKNKNPEIAAQTQLPANIKAPDGLKAVEIGNTSVTLQWNPVDSNQLFGYRLERSIAFTRMWHSTHNSLPVLPVEWTEHEVGGLRPYTAYHFRVKSAIDEQGSLRFGSGSELAYVLTRKQYQPHPPRYFRVTDVKQNSVSLTWTKPLPARDVNIKSYEYVVEMSDYSEDRTLNVWTECCTTTQQECTIKVEHNGTYRFRVTAINKEKAVSSLPEYMGDAEIRIHVETESGWLEQLVEARWTFPGRHKRKEPGSVVFVISCNDLHHLRELWMYYILGKVKKFFEHVFAQQAALASVATDSDLQINIDEEDFYTCRRHLLLTSSSNKGLRVVRPRFGHSRGTLLGLSEDYPVYCRPISHRTTCSQLDYLDPSMPTMPASAENKVVKTQLPEEDRPGRITAAVKPDVAYSVTIVGGVPVRTLSTSQVQQNRPPPDPPVQRRQKNKVTVTYSRRRMSCKDLGTGDCQGWLWKKKDQKKLFGLKWKKLWFVLKKFSLYYYAGPDALKAEGIINLPEYSVVYATDTECGRKFGIKASHSEIKTFFFATDSKEDRDRWLNKLHLASIQYDRQSIHDESLNIPELAKQCPAIAEGFGYYSESDEESEPPSPNPVSPTKREEKEGSPKGPVFDDIPVVSPPPTSAPVRPTSMKRQQKRISLLSYRAARDGVNRTKKSPPRRRDPPRVQPLEYNPPRSPSNRPLTYEPSRPTYEPGIQISRLKFENSQLTCTHVTPISSTSSSSSTAFSPLLVVPAAPDWHGVHGRVLDRLTGGEDDKDAGVQAREADEET
ncbi:uncharacterized protein LOC144909572 isoform X2 [Branchiostoma floridae x Branchiostoma belcheri]